MTVANDSLIEAADLDGLFLEELTEVQADSAQLPLGYYLNLGFQSVQDTTPVQRRQKTFVIPFDCYLETLTVQTGDMSGDVVVTLTGDGALPNWAINLEETVSSGYQELTRSFYDNTRTKAGDRGFRVLPKGSTVTITVSTTSTVTPSTLQVLLVLRQFFHR